MNISNTTDSGLAELEESLDRGEPWRYPTSPDEEMDPGMPNPWVIRATGVTTGTVRGEEVRFLNGVDSAGRKWSRLIGAKSLRETLLDGVIKEWSDEQQAYVETTRVGEVKPGERVAIQFRGFTTIKSGPHKGKEIPSLKVERPDALAEPKGGDDGIPW